MHLASTTTAPPRASFRAAAAPTAPAAAARAAACRSSPHHHRGHGRRGPVAPAATPDAGSGSGSTAPNPARAALSGLASSVYKLTASMATVDPSLPALWQGLQKLSLADVQAALRAGADPNQTNAQGDTPLLYIARQGHYKYPPSEIPTQLIDAGADMEATDALGRTPLQVSLLSGWQNIADLLIQRGASTAGVAAVKSSLTCPDCKRLVAQYNL